MNGRLFAGAYKNRHQPKHPSPSPALTQKRSHHGPDGRTHHSSKSLNAHRGPALLGHHHVRYAPSADRQGSRACAAGEESEARQHFEGCG